MTDPFLALNGNLLKDIQTERRTNTLFTTAKQIYFLDSHTPKKRALRSTENLVNKLKKAGLWSRALNKYSLT